MRRQEPSCTAPQSPRMSCGEFSSFRSHLGNNPRRVFVLRTTEETLHSSETGSYHGASARARRNCYRRQPTATRPSKWSQPPSPSAKKHTFVTEEHVGSLEEPLGSPTVAVVSKILLYAASLSKDELLPANTHAKMAAASAKGSLLVKEFECDNGKPTFPGFADLLAAAAAIMRASSLVCPAARRSRTT